MQESSKHKNCLLVARDGIAICTVLLLVASGIGDTPKPPLPGCVLAHSFESERARQMGDGTYDSKRFRAWVQQRMSEFDLAGASAFEIECLFPYRAYYDPTSLEPRLVELGRGKDAAAATALALRAWLTLSRGDFKELAYATVCHDGFASALSAGQPPTVQPRKYSAVWDLFDLLAALDDQRYRAAWQSIAKAQHEFSASDPANTLEHSSYLLHRYRMGWHRLPASLGLRLGRSAERQCAAVIEAGVDSDSRARFKRVQEQVDVFLRQQQLVEGPAPDLEFVWSSPELEAQRLSDLRGKIVVIHLWATTCANCPRYYPPLARVAERFAGDPVVVLGLTSRQRRAPTEDGLKTAKTLVEELAFTRVYTKKRGITWPIAFNDRSVIDRRLGIHAIPHLLVIDADGVIRANGPTFPYANRDGVAQPNLDSLERFVEGLLKK